MSETSFILASSSPRRKELLKLIGIEPTIIKPETDESREPGESVDEFLKRVTIEKGVEVYRDDFFANPVISSDTIVLCEGRLIGKPVDSGQAREFLELLSGNTHEVWTGVAVKYRGRTEYDVARTKVDFSPISSSELEFYLENENYVDKAGAYAIQGLASVFVNKIDGCYFNVMGFPINLFYNLLKRMEIEIFSESCPKNS